MSGYSNYPQSPSSYAGSPSMGGTGFMSQSPAQSEPQRSVHILTPCSVRQLFNAKQSAADDVFHLDGQPLSQVTIVGQVFFKNRNETNTTFELNDGSGSIPCRLWDQEEQQTEETWRELSYVRVVGLLKTFNEQRSFVGSKVRKITDMNEITYHLAEVIKVHLYNTRALPQAAETGENYQHNNQAYGNTNYGANGGYAAQPAGEDLRSTVLKIIKAHDHEPQGVHLDTISHELERQGCPTSAQDVGTAIESLESEAQIYLGAGDLCYKAVEL